MLTGGCHCGAIRYEAEGAPSDETLCHCSMCRRTTGAPLVAWFTVPRAGFRFTAGSPARYDSSAMATRGFCPRCGTQLTFERRDLPDEIDVTTASLDAPDSVPPRDQTHTGSRLPWMALDPSLPAHRTTREEG